MAKFKINDWVQIEDKALGLKAIGVIINIAYDAGSRKYYQISWKITECSKTQAIQPTTLYPIDAFDLKGCLAANATVLYG